MIKLENYNRALAIAWRAHNGQVDKIGLPYILHPLRVALSLDTADQKVVGLLHDTIEDSDTSLDDILSAFGPDIARAVDLLTKRRGQPYADYINTIKLDPVARAVKIADIKDNLLPSRVYPGRNDTKYKAALIALLS